MKSNRFFALLLGFVLVLSTPLALADDDDRFDTPEEAIQAFVRAITDGDLDDALDAFGCEQQARGYDWASQVSRQQVYQPQDWAFPAPAGGEFFADINEKVLEGDLSRRIMTFCFSFFVDDHEQLAGDMTPEGEQWPQTFAQTVDPRQLRELRAVISDPALGNDPAQRNNALAQLAAAAGADEAVDRLVAYELNGTFYEGGFTVMRYGQSWYLVHFGCLLLGQSTSGAVEKVVL